jgi:hypothetical protein
MENLGKSESTLLKTAAQMDHLLSEVISLQRDHVAQVCSRCEDPCCNRVQYLFDEKDTIFAKVSRQEGVPRRRHQRSRGCPFLTPTGCRLPPKTRPFTCHRYLCSRLKEEMMKYDPGLVNVLTEQFRLLEDLRARLWCEYLEMVAAPGSLHHSAGNTLDPLTP